MIVDALSFVVDVVAGACQRIAAELWIVLEFHKDLHDGRDDDDGDDE